MGMNNVLELRGKRFVQAPRATGAGGPSMNGNEQVTSDKIHRLQSKLRQLRTFWATETRPFSGVLISVHYNKIAAKSNRIAGIFKGKNSNMAIVGAKFNAAKTHHIITYYLSMADLDKSIDLLEQANKILMAEFSGSIAKQILEDKTIINSRTFMKQPLSQSLFKQIIADISYIEDFEIEHGEVHTQQSIVTLYDTKSDTKELLRQLGIDVLSSRILDNQTVFLDQNQMELLFSKAPYLVSMSTVDISELAPANFMEDYKEPLVTIPAPSNEPTIGVIDTLFDTRVYFSDWVEYHDLVDESIPKVGKDYNHGTAVTSIIVDGPTLNPWLDDGCGRFKVKHFGVATGSHFSSFTITKQIKEIVTKHKEIKVWNLSLGSNEEVNNNFISAEAAILDQIQFENDVIFIVAGTNKPSATVEKIGSPADSINSLVVNSVTKDGKSTNYTRKGIVLSFFAKPDVSYYGGSREQYIRVCEPLGAANVSGTSFAAPWIARKMSYLIDILGINRELAKALIIDAARGWDDRPTLAQLALYGHGIVPIHIEEIVKTKNDEIKFLVSDISEKWNTYNYDFPIPMKDEKYPYVARATLCYFPKCERTQGVDYTNTELNIKFGRIKDNGQLNDIKGDKQNLEDEDPEKSYLLEVGARENFRKWDNVKYVAEKPTTRNKSKISYTNKNWGMSIKTNNRLDPEDGIGVRFGVVVTLKEIEGKNRINEFIHNCYLNGWLVNQLDIELRLEIHQRLDEEIEFE